jgi:peptide/nickel transport system permease protein
MTPQSIWQRLARAAKDSSFIIGSIMVAILLIVAFIGPEIAPGNPYVRNRLQYINGEMVSAPIPPSPLYPLGTDAYGRDNISLLLYGARTTLVIVLVATIVRMLLGLILGALAGWFPNSLLDRAVSALTEFLAAIPGLILAMLVVYAVGIRSGQIAFAIAISLVGWGEVVQIFRSHVLTLRKQLFVEAARAVGLSPLEILSRHVLPNLIPTMLSLSALQAGGALLLMGELGFVNVFLGSGHFIPGDPGTPSTIIFEVPDWGAMLGTTWPLFRSLPWLPAVPALAFLFSILAFNIFGFGLQRFSERGRFYPSGLSVLRFLAIVTAVLFGLNFIFSQSGPQAAFKKKAKAFDVTQAWIDMSYLSRPELEGRYPGSEGSAKAASYIASQFEEADLTPFPYGSYFQTFTDLHGRITTKPVMDILGPDGEVLFTISDGLAYDPQHPFNSADLVEGKLFFHLDQRGTVSEYAVAGIFLLIGEDPFTVSVTEASGSFFNDPFHFRAEIVPDEQFAPTLTAPAYYGPASFLPEDPYLVIKYSTAVDIITRLGYNLEELEESRIYIPHHYYAEINKEPVTWFDLGVRARVRLGMVYELASGVNVAGYIPGSDARVQAHRILVVAPYSGPSPLEGQIYPGADENASGVAVMLEILRLWGEQEFVPKHTVVFAAFDENGGRKFIQDPILPTPSLVSESWTAVIIDGVGAGDTRLARLQAGGAYAKLFDRSARTMGARTEDLAQWPFFFAGATGPGYGLSADPAYSGLAVTRLGDALSGTLLDTMEHISPDELEKAGQVLAHFLMVLSSQ